MVPQQQTLSTIGKKGVRPLKGGGLTPFLPRAMVGCLALLTPALALLSGCATTNVAKAPETPPKGAPGQIVATWNKDVEFLPDRVNNGRLTPALSGRVYFFEGGSTEQKPIVADGSLYISVYDEHGRTNPDGTPVPLEVWQITPECMKLVMTKDWWGWGYTLNLPWNTYRPDISQVRFQVRYVPPKDAKDPMPVFSDCPMLALQHPGSTTQSTAQANARNSAASQQRTSGYTQSGVQPATSTWQVNLPANRNSPSPAPVGGADPK